MIISSRSTQELKSLDTQDPHTTAEFEAPYELQNNQKKRKAVPEKIKTKVITSAMIGK